MNMPERPLDESYWVVPGTFLAGEYPGGMDDVETAQRLGRLMEAGFDTYLDLTNVDELLPYEEVLHEEASRRGMEVTYHRFAIGDYGLPSHRRMKRLLDTIDAALAGGHKVYLHCWGGVGRTGTAVGCHLVRHGMSGEEALRQMAQWWLTVPKSRRHHRTPETDAQREFIMKWVEYG